MKKEPIVFEWSEKEVKHSKEIDRQNFLELMESVRKVWDGNNEISTQLVEIIPELTSILINKDRNDQKDIPSIHCVSENGEKEIEIIRHHKIIWSMLDSLCKE